MRAGLRHLAFCLVGVPVLLLAACGSTPKLLEAASSSPFAAATVAIRQMGNAPVTVNPASASFTLDDAQTLRVALTLTSHGGPNLSVIVRATLYSSDGSIIGDATGGQVNVPPGQPTKLLLTGPTPLGTIASAVFEVSIPPPRTLLPVGAPAPESQLPTPT